MLLTLGISAAEASPLAYMVTGAKEFGTLDLSSGVFTLDGTEAVQLAGLGVANSELYGVSYASGVGTLYQVNTANGNLSTIGTDSTTEYLAFGSTLTGLYALDNNFMLRSINAATGISTIVGSTGLSPGGNYELSTNSGTLYFALGSNLYTLNTTTGANTLVGGMGGGQQMGGLLLTGGILFGGETNPAHDVATLNTGTGAATAGPAITGTANPVAGLAPDPLPTSSTPEPGTWLFLISGVAALALCRRR